MPSDSTPLEDYALLGDCETAALVSRRGSVDWLCWPRFDAPACLAALLGTPEHGRWLLAPVDPDARPTRRYRPDTLVLETDWETRDGSVTVVECMPPADGTPNLVRQVVGRRGRVAMRTELVLRFDYGASVPWVTRLPDAPRFASSGAVTGVRAIAGPSMVALRAHAAPGAAPIDLHGEGLTTVAEFGVGAGETASFVLAHAPSHGEVPFPIDAAAAIARTTRFWQAWAERCTYRGPHAEAVRRSLVTLKALTYAPTGGMVAAPTTSVPEQLGGPRNWDYRYCWLRDATLTLLALMDAGYYEEAGAWRDWLLRAAAGSPAQTQIMYGLAGERLLPEFELPWLPGYAASRPVRVGNAAHEQRQLDVYGEVVDALHQARVGGLAESPDAWALERALVEQVAAVWEEPDEGIWEVRGPRQHFTHSKVMAWVAADRAVQAVEGHGLAGDAARWRALRDRIHADVCARAWNAELGAFTQAYGSDVMDASVLLMPLVGFLPARDPRVLGTVAAVERTLVTGGLVRRYNTHETADGLPPGEGAFLACSFWLADNYVLQGRVAEAEALFARLTALATDLGLLAEEYDPAAGRLVGNFPQAFSHVALVGTALNLARCAPGRDGAAPGDANGAGDGLSPALQRQGQSA
jgi:GH15 family glucan-1,4-alpha-glucosidase